MKKTMRENYMEMKVMINELKDMLVQQAIVDGGIESIDEDSFKALQICFKLVKTSEELMESYIEQMEEQDRKLDKILKALETAR